MSSKRRHETSGSKPHTSDGGSVDAHASSRRVLTDSQPSTETLTNGTAKEKLQNGNLSEYRISKETQKILVKKGINSLFPIQQKTFDPIFDGKHVIGRARTGTGKTLAFALPSIESLSQEGKLSKKGCRLLVLLPTRELAQQVAADFELLGRNETLFRTATVVGGVPEDSQLRALNQGAQVVVGTPGRILDFLSRSLLALKKLRIFVLDEADQMLEMGFKEDVDGVLQYIASAKTTDTTTTGHIQMLLFTATLPAWVTKIAEAHMTNGEKVIVDVVKGEQVSTASGIRHLTIVCGFHQRHKVLGTVIAHYAGSTGRCIVFVETKANANDISMTSNISHFCQVLHGDVPQKQRELTLKAFKEGKFRCLVATDVAARGLHVDNIELVIQLEPPKDVDTFIHRAGRTGRAGAKGTNVVFMNPMNAPFIKTIESLTGIRFTRVGIPQVEQILSTEVRQIVEKTLQMQKPHPAILNQCKDAVQHLLLHMNTDDAALLLLLQLAGSASDMAQSKVVYSALTGNEGYKTYVANVLSGITIQSKNYVWQVLKNGAGVDQDTLNAFQSMTLKTDGSGALFDVPMDKIPYFESCVAAAMSQKKNKETFSIHPVTELPDLNDARLHVTGAASNNSKNPFARGGKRQRDDGNFRDNFKKSRWQR